MCTCSDVQVHVGKNIILSICPTHTFSSLIQDLKLKNTINFKYHCYY